jgi:two-component system sensor histidine kinase DesK
MNTGSLTRELGWTPYAWLVYLAFFLVVPVLQGGPASVWVATLAALALFLPLYFRGFRETGRRALLVALAILAIGMAVTPLNHGGNCFFIYSAAFIGHVGRPRQAFRWLLLVLALPLVEAYVLGWPVYVWLTALVVGGVVGGTNIHFAEVRRQHAKVRVAQEAAEEMARIAERERISRDLHDLLGHTLSLIVLKSELASKLAERDPARAASAFRARRSARCARR